MPWIIVLLLSSFALQAMMICVERVYFLGAWHAPGRTAQIEIGLHRALHGRGPEESDLQALRQKALLSDGSSQAMQAELSELQVRNGSFDLHLETTRTRGNLTWRLVEADGDATLFWICGYARPPAGVAASTLTNLTDVPPLWLPSVCRDTP